MTYATPLNFKIIASVTIVLLGVIVWDGLTVLTSRWVNDEAYTHGFILVVMVGYLIYQESGKLKKTKFGVSWVGFVGFCFFSAVLFISYVTQIQTLQYQAFLATACFFIIAIMGRASVLVLLPASLLVFAIPLPYFTQVALTADLQLLSSQLAAATLRFLDISVHLEGNIIDLGHYRMQVVEACAGLNYMVPLLGLGHILAYMFKTVMWKRILLVVSAIPISVLLNSTRITMTGWLMDVYGIDTAEGFFHAFQGWLIFVVSIIVLGAEMVLLNKFGAGRVDLVKTLGFAPASQGDGEEGAPVEDRPVPKTLYPLFAVALLVAGITFYVDSKPEYIPERPNLVLFPERIDDWRGRPYAGSIEQMELLGADDHLFSTYRQGVDDKLIDLYVAYFDRQTDDKNPHSPKACLPGSGWEILTIEQVEKQIGPDQVIPINKMMIQQGAHKQLMYYWFNLHGQKIADEYKMKANLLRDRLLLNRSDGAIVRLTSPYYQGESLEMVEKRMDDFLASLDPVLDEFIPGI